MAIVESFKEKLEADLGALKLGPLNNWVFARTHAKKNPEALKWTLSKKGSRFQIASTLSVRDLIKHDGLKIKKWGTYYLVVPRELKSSRLPAKDQLVKMEASVDNLIKEVESGQKKSKEALMETLALMKQITKVLVDKSNDEPVPVEGTQSERKENALYDN